jgi:thiamine biosynthesis lipoprotein
MKSKKIFLLVPVLFCFALFFLFYLKNNTSVTNVQKQTRFLMDTYCTIQIPGGTEVIKTIEKAFDRIEEIEKKFNVVDPTNDLYEFNAESVPITDQEIIDLIESALIISKETYGAFDITIYPLIDLWGFFSDRPQLPKDDDIKKTLKHISYKYLSGYEEKINKSDNKTKIDLGGIAKGYAIKEAIDIIRSQGIESALIDAGGDIYAMGELNNKPWKVGIQNPRGEGVIGAFDISDLAVVTSGDYERFFEKDSTRYHHLLDPKTGYPARGLASVTVISSDPVRADAFATAIFILGKDKGLELAEKTTDLETLIITEDGDAFSSSGL